MSLSTGFQPAAAGPDRLTPGTSYFGRNQYIEYIAGDLPLVISVPHGGDLLPAELPDREQAVAVADSWSIEYTLAVADAIHQLTGRYPHIVINHIQRVKLDANRDMPYGAQDSPAAQQAWREFHDFLDMAEASAVEQCGRGLYLDLHSNGQAGGWIQLGYGIPGSDLTLSNEELDRPGHVNESSLRSLSTLSGEGLSSLLRSPESLGGLLASRGYKALPSNYVPWPPGIVYFDGGYNVIRHGSKNGGGVDGIQVETSVDYVRPEKVEEFAGVLGEAILTFMEMHYGFALGQGNDVLCPSFADVGPGSPSYTAIETLFSKGVLQACSANPRLFCPDAPLTRGEAAEMIGKAIRPEATWPLPAESIYQDILPEDPLAPWTTVMWQSGLGPSCREDRLVFCPDQPFSRAEAAKTFLLILKGPAYIPPEPSGSFIDMQPQDWDTWWAEAAYLEGLFQGCRATPQMEFCPDAPMTRSEAATLLALVSDSRTTPQRVPGSDPAHEAVGEGEAKK